MPEEVSRLRPRRVVERDELVADELAPVGPPDAGHWYVREVVAQPPRASREAAQEAAIRRDRMTRY
jgi:hypothetical protein